MDSAHPDRRRCVYDPWRTSHTRCDGDTAPVELTEIRRLPPRL